MNAQNLKILPLLIFVALLAFSVRLVEVVGGVSELSGSAYAEDSASYEEAAHTPAEEHAADETHEQNADDEHDMEMSANDDPPEWRDAIDEDPGYEAIKEDLYAELVARRKELDKKERELQTREALMKAATQELDRKYQELARLKQEIESLLKTQSDEENARVQSLVKIYEGMKPKDAARIFDTLDLDILVSVVASMSERKLSPILAAMNPERARTITIMLAEQKQLPDMGGSN